MSTWTKHRLTMIAKELELTREELIRLCKTNDIQMYTDSQDAYISRAGLDVIIAKLAPSITIDFQTTILPSDQDPKSGSTHRAKQFVVGFETALEDIKEDVRSGRHAHARRKMVLEQKSLEKFMKYGPSKSLTRSELKSMKSKINFLSGQIKVSRRKSTPKSATVPKRIADSSTHYRRGYSIYDDAAPDNTVFGGAPTLGKRSK